MGYLNFAKCMEFHITNSVELLTIVNNLGVLEFVFR